ncbi:MAG TPA: hypothetical protein VIT41_19020 [Microlunatus sp.]
MPTVDQVLSRFPRHLDADQPGKVIGQVAAALATPLDSQLSQNGKLRRTHRSAEVEQHIDLLRLGGLHGFLDRTYVPVQRRLARLDRLDVGTDDGVEEALQLLGLGSGSGLLDRFPGETDDGGARTRLAAALAALAAYDAWLPIARRTLVAVIGHQRAQSTTVAGLLGTTADHLGLELVEVRHDEPGGYWHLGRCRDRLRPVRPRPAIDAGGAGEPDGDVPGSPVAVGEHLLALEENPPFLADVGPIARRHADRFHVSRHGFDTVPCTVVVKGLQDRTLEPMIVNLDTGEGLATTLSIPDGGVLRFERDGRVELDGSSVALRSYTFHGAVFAADGAHPKDFVFADQLAVGDPDPGPGSATASGTTDRIGRYTVTAPPSDVFDPLPSFPHGEALLRPLTLDRAETRFAVFSGAGVFGSLDSGGADVLAAPEPVAGRFDQAVFLPDPAGARSLEVGFEWDEREAYALRVWLPHAFGGLDAPDEPSLREVIRLLLDRQRAAGVHVYVDYADPRWVLGTGVIRDVGTTDALGQVVAGTQAWEDETPQPVPAPGGSR